MNEYERFMECVESCGILADERDCLDHWWEIREQLFAEYLMEAGMLPTSIFVCESVKDLPPSFCVSRHDWPKEGYVYCIPLYNDTEMYMGWVQPTPRWYRTNDFLSHDKSWSFHGR